MAYAAGENPFSYPELKYDKIKLFIAEASKLVDYIILDCSSNMLNFFTPARSRWRRLFQGCVPASRQAAWACWSLR